LEEVSTVKKKNSQLLRKLQNANDPKELLERLSRHDQAHKSLPENISSLNGELRLREEKMDSLKKELEIAHRSLDVQSKYERRCSTNNTYASSSDREILRTLYFDMGKKEEDLYCVTVPLADSARSLNVYKADLQKALKENDTIYEENSKLRGNIDHMNVCMVTM
jgi:chromosome segregation ATPase